MFSTFWPKSTKARRELYTRNSKRTIRAPPQVPRRNPETRLSSGSTGSQEQIEAQFHRDGPGLESGYGTADHSETDFPSHTSPHPSGYHGNLDSYSYGYPDGYHTHPAVRNGDSSYQASPIGGVPLPPPLPPGGSRISIDSGGSMPHYPAPPLHGNTRATSNGQSLLSMTPPPPPPQFDMGANMTVTEEHYETRLPTPLDEHEPLGGGTENIYGAQLPPPGLNNGYPPSYELYETTLPKPQAVRGPAQAPSLPSHRSSISSSSSSYRAGYSSSESIVPTNYGTHKNSTESPESDFPPPPPPQFFQTMPAPSSGPGSPVRPPPPTLPKPKKGNQPVNGGPPPPPPLSTMPRGPPLEYNGPPLPPSASTIPRAGVAPPPPPQALKPSLDVGGLAEQLQGVQLRSSPPEEKPAKTSSSFEHLALINQIQHGVQLRKSPAGKKIRGNEVEIRPDDNSDTYSETGSVASSGSNDDSSTGSSGRPAPPTLPKPNKPSPSHTSTMPSSGHQANQSSQHFEEFDVTQLEGYQPVPEECPSWKRAMIERKNKQLVESYMKHIDDQRREEQKWEGVPAWKKSLMQEKEKKKYDDVAPQEEEKRKRQEDEIRFHAMPEWKRHLLLKKRGDL